MRPLSAAPRHPYARHDPAPSRLAYRLDRLWLTPLFRALMRVGLPAFVIIMAVGIYIGDAGRRAAIGAQIAGLRQSIEDRPEFMVSHMAIDGASPAVAEAVRKLVPVTLPASSFSLDLEAIRATIAQLDAVAEADLFLRPGGILQVTIRERVPALLWRNAGRIEMLDAEGHRVATLLDRAARPDLPMIAGEGADSAVAEARAVLDAAGPLLPRLRALVRMGERRWDIILDRDQRILLPEDDPAVAVGRLVAVDQAQDLLGRDVLIVDMRNENRPTLRLAAGAVEELRRFKEIETGVTDQ
jgi:cell division protein FtsQ